MGRKIRRFGARTCILLTIVLLANGTALGKTPIGHEDSQGQTAAPGGGQSAWIKSISQHLETEFTLTTGIRSDDLDWSIAGNNVNYLSELTWSNVDSYQISLANRTQLKNRLYFRGAFNFAWIQDGTVRDSDYGQDNRGGEWSRSISDTTGDELWDLSGGGGYSFYFLQNRLTISPLVGLSYHKQNLRIQNGNQVVSGANPFGGSNPPATGPLDSRLDSTYFARWFGPWIGCDLRYRPKIKPNVYHAMELRLSLELHWADYYGEGNWNLRSDLAHPKSFEHETYGYGISITGQWLINIANQWDLTFSASHQDWSTDDGTDRKFLSGGGTTTTRLNKVNWESTSFMVGVTYHF